MHYEEENDGWRRPGNPHLDTGGIYGVSDPGVSSGLATNLRLAIGPDDTPYLAYSDDSNGGELPAGAITLHSAMALPVSARGQAANP
jgi:hypothetical protein